MTDDTEKFRSILWAQQKWPGIYFFKFIVPNNRENLEQVKMLFPPDAEITYRTSRDIRFIALSCKHLMANPDEVLALYENAGKIEGVISL
jgi:hypothetical protein